MSKLKPHLKINIPVYAIGTDKEKPVGREPNSAKNSAFIKGKNKLNEMPPIYRQSPKAGSRPMSITKNTFMTHLNSDTPPIIQNIASQGTRPTKLKEITFNPSKTFSPNYQDVNHAHNSDLERAKSKNQSRARETQVSASNLGNIGYIGGASSSSFYRAKSKDRSTPSTTKNQVISIMSLFASNLPLDIKHLHSHFSNYDNSKYSAKSLGVVKSYSANTHQGTVRDYNEDRVSIILNIIKPSSYTGSFWPKCSFFGIYDGHGGSGCAEFLRDNLHHYVVRDENFPVNPKEALIQGFKAAENEFILNHALTQNGYDIRDKSGSCAIVVLVVDDSAYIANVGDSRAIMSKCQGKEVTALSRDHKPDDPDESKRIQDAGGKIYQ